MKLQISPTAVNRLTDVLLSNRHTLVEAILLHSRLPTCGKFEEYSYVKRHAQELPFSLHFEHPVADCVPAAVDSV